MLDTDAITAIQLEWPQKTRALIEPVFLPFMGCPSRCVFCNQTLQTGRKPVASLASLTALLDSCLHNLESRKTQGRAAPEIAFYGGTFTGIPAKAWEMCLAFIAKAQTEGMISGFRCSTRPDCVTPQRIHELAQLHCGLVELGCQSFSDNALQEAQRGYGRQHIHTAIDILKDCAIPHGIQLMPGMPGVTPEIFTEDVELALETEPANLRFYPCLVLNDARLADLWRKNLYSPWSLPTTINALSDGWLTAHKKNVPVIRMGIAPQPEAQNAILAGPADPALGNRVIGMAICKAVAEILPHGFHPVSLTLPRPLQGAAWGHKNERQSDWQKIGINRHNLKYHTENVIILQCQRVAN